MFQNRLCLSQYDPKSVISSGVRFATFESFLFYLVFSNLKPCFMRKLWQQIKVNLRLDCIYAFWYLIIHASPWIPVFNGSLGVQQQYHVALMPLGYRLRDLGWCWREGWAVHGSVHGIGGWASWAVHGTVRGMVYLCHSKSVSVSHSNKPLPTSSLTLTCT